MLKLQNIIEPETLLSRVIVISIRCLCFIFFSSRLCGPATGEMIQLESEGGAYLVPVRINDAITLNFVLDTGAADVAIPADVFLTLTRTGTVKTSDFIGTGTYVLADGSEQASKRFVLRELRVGDHVISNVIANVAPVKGDPLLGQSFLSKLPAWTIDNERHALVLNDMPGAIGVPERAALPPPQLMPSPAAPAAPAGSNSGLSVGELVQHGRQAASAQNYVEAMRWYRIAADQGNALAQYNIGSLYANGLGVPRDYSQAMRWYRMAADRGLVEAQCDITPLYAKLRHTQRNYAEAVLWFSICLCTRAGGTAVRLPHSSRVRCD
jgi:clan AA aspartic protease (TIGR02281 family)